MADVKKWSSLNIELKVGPEGSEQKINGLTDIPDMGATPEKLDVTTLSDPSRKYIEGIKDYGDLEFTFIYESGENGNYAQLAKLEGEQSCIVTFPDGSTFTFKGEISLRIVGVGVNAVITFVMAVALSEDIVYAAGN